MPRKGRVRRDLPGKRDVHRLFEVHAALVIHRNPNAFKTGQRKIFLGKARHGRMKHRVFSAQERIMGTDIRLIVKGIHPRQAEIRRSEMHVHHARAVDRRGEQDCVQLVDKGKRRRLFFRGIGGNDSNGLGFNKTFSERIRPACRFR